MNGYDVNYDVIVCGGGTSGFSAAIQAARGGAKTLLIERTGCLGGQLTVSGPPGFAYARMFNCYGQQDSKGIGQAMRCLICAPSIGLARPTPSPTLIPNGGF